MQPITDLDSKEVDGTPEDNTLGCLQTVRCVSMCVCFLNQNTDSQFQK